MQVDLLVKNLNLSIKTWLGSVSKDPPLAAKAKEVADKIQMEVLKRGILLDLNPDMTFRLPKGLESPKIKEDLKEEPKSIKEKINEESLKTEGKFSKKDQKDE